MTTLSNTNFIEKAPEYLDSIAAFNDTVTVTTEKGSVVLMSENDYSGLMETIYLLSIPSMKERLEEAQTATLDDCEDFSW